LNPAASTAFQFVLTPGPATLLTFTDLQFGNFSAASGPIAWSLRSSLDNFATDIATATFTNDSTWTLQTATPFSVSSGTAVTFRLFGYGGTGSINTRNWQIDDMQLSYTTPVTLHWDANGGAGTGGTGVWNTTTPNWNTASDGSGSAQNFTSANRAFFGGTAGEVTIGPGGVTASAGIVFDAFNYVVKSDASADKLTLGPFSTIAVTSNAGLATISAGIDGANGLTKTGPGTLTLTGSNVFTGIVTLSAGGLVLGSDAALGDPANDLVIGDFVVLRVTDNVTLGPGRSISGSSFGSIINLSAGIVSTNLEIAGPVNLGALELDGLGTGTLTLSGPTRTIGSLKLDSTETLVSTGQPIALGGDINAFYSGGTAAIQGGIDYGALGEATRTVNVVDATAELVITGSLTATGTAGKLEKSGAGTLRLEGDNSGFLGIRLGSPALIDGGTLEVTDHRALGTTEFEFNAGTLKLTGSFTGANAFPSGVNLAIGGRETAPSRFTGNGAEFLGGVSVVGGDFNDRNQINVETTGPIVINGSFNDTGSSALLALGGSGAIYFKGATNTVNGTILVNGPTVELHGSFPNLNANVATGELNFDVTTLSTSIMGDNLGDDVTLSAAGAGSSALSIFTLELHDDVTVQFQFDSAAQIADHVNVTDSLSLGSGTVKLLLDDAALVPALLPIGFKFTLFDGAANATVSGFFEGYPEGAQVDVGLNHFNISYVGGADGKDVVLTVPEPGSASLALAGIAGLLIRRQRRW
jgi:autotransporter-associated beta strand protein